MPPDRVQPSILVVGCGSAGRRHIRNLQALGVERIAACDPEPDRLSYVTTEYNVRGFGGFEEALGTVSPEAVIVCTPPHLHVSQALSAVRSGAHAFVEKPVSHSMSGVDALISLADQRDRVVQVGYNLRYHPGLEKVKALLEDGIIGRVLWARAEFGQYLPDWRPWQDYRRSYTARREMGGGIILDASHEVEYLTWLIGDVTEVTCIAERVSSLEVDVEDTAMLLVRFLNGALGEIHLDFLQRVYTRNCKVVGELGTLEVDLSSAEVRLLRPGATTSSPFQTDPDFDLNTMYIKELEHFLQCVNSLSRPGVDLMAARRVLEVALAAHASARSRRAVSVA